jgi:hypothetical protein
VLDPTNGDWLGHIIAGKPGTSVAYIVLARDIVKDITNQLGVPAVQMVCEAELEVMHAVADIKRALPLKEPSSAYQGAYGSMFTTPVEEIALAEGLSIGGGTIQEPPSKCSHPTVS